MSGKHVVAVLVVGAALFAAECVQAETTVPVQLTRGRGAGNYRRATQSQQKQLQQQAQAWQKLEAEQAAAAEAEAKKHLEQRQAAADTARQAKDRRRTAAKRLIGAPATLPKSATGTKPATPKASESSVDAANAGTVSERSKIASESAASGGKTPIGTANTTNSPSTISGKPVDKLLPK